MSTDGSSEVFGGIIIAGIVSTVLIVVVSVATWFHVRSEARKDAECTSRGGVRIEVGSNDLCIRKDAIIKKF